ncbi:MAG: B12-binding domain-containing protein [Candidatus Thorarchaeota archaeon]
MNENDILEKLRNAIINGNSVDTIDLTKKALIAKVDPKQILNDAIIKGADIVGGKYENAEYFLGDMLLAAEAINDCMNEIKPILKEAGHKVPGKVVIGTPEGDLHDIGKSLVIALLQGQGFEVIDLGVDVKPERFLEVAKKENVDIVGLSGLLTMTISKMRETITLLKQEGISAKIILGGGVLSEESCRQIGADAWAKDGWEGVKKIKEIMGDP